MARQGKPGNTERKITSTCHLRAQILIITELIYWTGLDRQRGKHFDKKKKDGSSLKGLLCMIIEEERLGVFDFTNSLPLLKISKLQKVKVTGTTETLSLQNLVMESN